MTEASILIVDDDPPSRYVKSHLLARNGYAMLEAGSGTEALALVAVEAPALVVLDVKLSDMSGLDVCREIKSRFPQCLVLQTSAAFIDVADRTRALDVGADGYLIEPIEPAELLSTVRALLRLHRAEQGLRKMNEGLELLIADRTHELEDTHRRLANEMEERQKAETLLWHAQKLDLIGRFTGGIAHDFNNLLTIIAGNLELMKDGLNGRTSRSPERLLHMVLTAEAAAEKGARITQRLLGFARRTPGEAALTQVADLVPNWQSLFAQAVGETIELDFSCEPDLWNCMIDRNQLEAALVNLVVNAKDAVPKDGQVHIRVRNCVVSRSQAAARPGVPAGDYVEIAVADTGSGMTDDVLDHIFEPFFTTKSVGQGSGLGLSQVYGFVRQSSGYIQVESTLGAGSTFILRFPRAGEEMIRSDEVRERDADGCEGGKETVLIVDDDQEVRDVTGIMVGSLGYQVMSAANGNEALKIIESREGVDLVITDIVMPDGIDGFELARRVRSLRPGLPILMTSGYTSDWAEKPECRKFAVLRKPYRTGELARHIRAALDQAPLSMGTK